MELLSPEFLGGAGVTIGGIGIGVLLVFVFQLGGIKKSFDDFLKEVKTTMTRNREHQDREEEHHKRVDKHHEDLEELAEKIEGHLRPALSPRPVTGDHTPVHGIDSLTPQ